MKRAAKKGAASGSARGAAPATRQQVSAGGVAWRQGPDGPQVVLISVDSREGPRWQLPKGLVDAGETPEAAALREVREEAGVTTELVAPIETIEYWYVGQEQGRRMRFHKFVHFFLLRYRSGDVADHDQEVLEARWVSFDEALKLLAFANERRIVEEAREMIGKAQDEHG